MRYRQQELRDKNPAGPGGSAAATKSVPAVERALLIFQELSKHGAGVTLSELVRRLGLPRSSIHCHLLTLERLGYLHKDEETGRFLFGLQFFSLANRAVAGLGLRRISGPHLYALMRKTGMTVHMGVLDRHEAVLIEAIDSPYSSRIGTWVGRRMPVHCTAIGKALIASWGDEQIERLIGHGLTRYNDNTIASASSLKAHLARTRELGYSVDDEEEAIGLRCIGVPVRDGRGQIVAAISVAGRTDQIDGERFATLAEEVKAAARVISQQLGEPDVPGTLLPCVEG
ncbi:MAG: IclR family transcriptional regulator [Vicinamibacterales bacterium]